MSLRRRKWWKFPLLVIVLIVPIGFLVRRAPESLHTLGWLAIREVRVTTEWPLEPGTVRSWLPNLEGRNLLAVNASRIVDLLRARPWVESVTLKKEYPDRIVIDITAKRARAIRIVRGSARFVDAAGRDIDAADPFLLKTLDLPVIAGLDEGWDFSAVLSAIDSIQTTLGVRFPISQVDLGTFPFFRVFLSSPSLELSFSLDTWESQLPALSVLVQRPPLPLGSAQKIDLVLPKRAVVTTSESRDDG